MPTETITHLDTRDAAKILRGELKVAFPGVKFSVRIQRYAGGSSIRVEYTDGPALEKVQNIARDFNGRGFDGMTDSTFYYPAFTRDGLKYATTCFCFVERSLSDETLQAVADTIAADYGIPTPTLEQLRNRVFMSDPQETLWWGRQLQDANRTMDL